MRAVINGAPLEIEGEPAEIAQLVELLTTQAVFVEHKHRWRIGELDGSPTVRGACWCGAEREFDPTVPERSTGLGAPTSVLGLAGANHDEAKQRAGIGRRAKGTRGGPHPCSVCGQDGHNKRTCPQRMEAA